jgi:type II secretory pathway component GspD/PulD (secretin)
VAAVGIALTPAGEPAQAQPPVPVPAATNPADPGTVRPSRVYDALQTGTELYRKGDYESAAIYFQKAQVSQDDLSAADKQSLANWVQLNSSALTARRNGADQIRKADVAMRQGRTQEAIAYLKAATPNQQYLAAADKQTFQRLSEKLMPVVPDKTQLVSSSQDGTESMARSKVKQARLLLSKGNYEAAQLLAQEADRLQATYAANEDTPRKVLADIEQARHAASEPKDAKGLLIAARAALAHGQIDRAEQLAHQSEKASSMWTKTTQIWGDSPSKVLKDVQVERAKQAAWQKANKKDEVQVAVSVKPPAQAPAVTGDNTEVARRLLKDARQALQAGDVAKAQQLAERARSLRPDLKWWDDTPDKLLADIRQVERVNPQGKPRDAVAEMRLVDPRPLVKQARELLDEGKFDESEKVALQAQGGKKIRWGLFEDTPEAVLADLKKARTKQDQEDSVSVLAKARKLYEDGHYTEAAQLAHKAERMHGSYSWWDLGDRPAKLLADIRAAEAKNRVTQLPPPPTDDVNKVAAKVVVQVTTPTTPAPTGLPNSVQAPALPALPSVAALPATPALPGPADSRPTLTQPMVNTTMPNLPPLVQTSGTEDNRKVRAQALLSEARLLEKNGQLVEARQKALEAQRLAANFGPNEDRPELCLLSVNARCQRRIEELVQKAEGYLSTARSDASRYPWAVQTLTEARGLAVAFGLDTQLIDDKLTWVRQTSNGAVAMPSLTQAQHQVAVDVTQSHGKQLLDQARRELRAGQISSARRLAEAAYEPQYGVQAEAEQILRSIDAEEFNQKVLADQRAFNAGLEAFVQQRYTQAAAIFRQLDPHRLTPEQQARLKDIMLSPEMQPTRIAQVEARKPGMATAVASDQMPSAPQVADAVPAANAQPSADLTKQVLAMQEVQFQALRSDGLEAQRRAMELFKAGDTDRALEVLEEYRVNLTNSKLDSERIALLRRPIDSRYQQFKTLKHQRDFEKLQASQTDELNKKHVQEILHDEEMHKQVAELMKQYRTLYKEGKYEEAQVAALKAHDLDPDDVAVSAAMAQAQMAIGAAQAKRSKESRENMTLTALNEAENAGPTVSDHHPLLFDRGVTEGNRGRKGAEILQLSRTKSEKEKEIYRKLDAPISSMDYSNTPLKQILADLGGWTGINIVPDTAALTESGISLEKPVDMKLEGVSLKSALNLLLRQVHLTYIVKDEVLQVTTEENTRGKYETRIHPVVDLVIPVENTTGATPADMLHIYSQGNEQGGLKMPGVQPYESRNGLPGGQSVGMNQLANNQSGNMTTTKSNPKNTIEDVLIKLITNSVEPQSWASMGGRGTIEFFPLGMALVINQTPDIQEQVAELLQALRRLQDQEVAIEVRFITVAESFYERIGLNLNINIRNNETRYEPQIVSQQFRPFGFINHFTPSRFISGLTPGGTFTQDLNIPITQNSFQMDTPPFGQYPGIPGGNGGLSLGLAFLSDIEVYLFMEAAQGDQRTNVMQAPKLTLFNGQTSTLSVADSQFFVTSVTVGQLGGQVFFIPNNNLIQTGGVNLSLNAVISADRRFVRMSIAPTLVNLSSANVPLFPVTTFITPIFEGGAVGQPVPFTQFLQQPGFGAINANTTVNVPDGGTVLLGGLKRLSEGRNENGPPILSKIPYLDRLFRNTAYGRDTESLMIMVTPRIIINEEEELRQVPGNPLAPGGQ